MFALFREHYQVFMGGQPDHGTVWRDYRRVLWARRISTPFVLFPILSIQYSFPLVLRVVGWTLVGVFVYSALRLGTWQCPRWKKRFLAPDPPRQTRPGDWWSRRCMNCGLLRGDASKHYGE